jgi:sugar lactone lactonase YvrE
MNSSVRARVYLENLPHDISSPFFDSQGDLHFLLNDSGDIMRVNQSLQPERLHSTNGSPCGASFASNETLYIADTGHGAILALHPDGSQDFVVGVYEDKPLKGPTSVKCDQNANIYFTDSGPFGETGLHSTTGSLYVIANSPSGQILKPIALETLAGPSCVALSPNTKYVYVKETV